MKRRSEYSHHEFENFLRVILVIVTDVLCCSSDYNNMGSHNVRTHWMYLHIINIGMKMVWRTRNM